MNLLENLRLEDQGDRILVMQVVEMRCEWN